MKQQNGMKGVTLLEIMLVLAIASSILLMALNYGTRQMAQQRLDKTALQMQQILNAAQAYYLTHGQWPTWGSGTCTYGSSYSWNGFEGAPLQTTYFPAGATLANPFGFGLWYDCDAKTGANFYVYTQLPNNTDAQIVAGELPIAFVANATGIPSSTDVYVVAQVSLPGQNLNNARSVNFAGVYRHGGCVSEPACPNFNPATNLCYPGTTCMTPQIMVAPVSVSGLGSVTGTGAPVYPITSFTAFATGPSTAPPICDAAGAVAGTSCNTTGGGPSPSGYYWRICLQVLTEEGDVSVTTNGALPYWGQNTAIMAVTRCAPPSEPIGSGFGVFTP